jgi:MYXO-CTERM domain-containing protein
MRQAILFVAAVMLTPATQVIAQSNNFGEVDVGDDQSNDNGNSKFGLLGLLGLGGLLGLKRRDPDIHVDARRNQDR